MHATSALNVYFHASFAAVILGLALGARFSSRPAGAFPPLKMLVIGAVLILSAALAGSPYGSVFLAAVLGFAGYALVLSWFVEKFAMQRKVRHV